MKKLLARSGLTERNLLILLLVLIYAFGGYMSWSVSLGVFYAVVMPWSAGLIWRDRHAEGIPRGAAPRFGIAAMLVSILSAMVTMTVGAEWGYTVGMIYIYWLLLLMPPKDHSPADADRELFGVGALVTTLYMPLAVVALISVFTGKTMNVPGLSGLVGIQKSGAEAGRIRIMAHANITARYAVMNVLFSVYAIVTRRKVLLRVWFALCIAVNLMVLAHAQSRTCYIALGAALGALLLRGAHVKLKGGVKGLLVGAIAAAAVFMLTLNGLNGLFESDVRLARLIDNDPKAADQVVSRVEKQGQFDVVGNGRDEIWGTAIEYLMDNPRCLITGMGEVDVAAQIAQTHPQMAAYSHLHNSLLAALMHYGAAYLICVLGFLLALVGPAWRLLMRRCDGAGRGLYVVPAFLIALLLMSMTEEMLFTRTCYSNVMFFFLSGLALRHGRRLKKEEIQNEN